ncbi:hypothetical protein CYR55_06195 [Chimaeribacter californicus]|uniref:Uncharacterized protein n=2 Tax=Chimaeribacter californicus TaxID=2060067 RepID=A0A2N5EEE6_9GAMM|nr:hypothetical protein CYR55_06195 [Chimaeribacter californicus]
MHYLKKKTFKRRFLSKEKLFVYLITTILITFMMYLSWAIKISRSTILFSSFPQLTWILTISALGGLPFAWRACCRRPIGETPKYIFQTYFSGFSLFLLLSLNAFEVYVYLFPDKIISYVTDYDVTFPGPPRGRSGRCKAGLLIKDLHTSRWIELCSSKEALKISDKRKQGMDGMWITTKVNELGTYIVKYEFTYK